MFRTLLLASIATAALGCVADSSDSSGSQSDDISASSRTYVAVRRDTRECFRASPDCGGYYVHDVNRASLNEKYVSGFDFSASGFDDDTIDLVTKADPGEIILHGKLGAIDHSAANTQKFVVSEAWRGLPGLVPAADAVFYATADRDPQIKCFTAPCNEENATKLNSTTTTSFTTLGLGELGVGNLDTVWTEGRALRNGGLVAGAFQTGALEPGGRDKVLQASQVYVKLPNAHYACAIGPEHACGDEQVTYTRDENLCMHFDQCVSHHACPQYVIGCADGYDRQSWVSAPNACATQVCVPSFITGSGE